MNYENIPALDWKLYIIANTAALTVFDNRLEEFINHFLIDDLYSNIIDEEITTIPPHYEFR